MTPIVSELFLRTQSDERLVSLARSGHNQAFVAIVSRYQRELLVFARRSGPEARAEDVVQQAMLNAFVALRGGTEVTHLRGWLYTIVRRGLAKAAAGEPVAEVDAGVAAITEPLEDVVLRRARARDTLAAVRGLPSRQRTALIATVFQGQRRSDIAQTLGQSEGSVRQLVHRARHNVRNAVGGVMPYPLARWVFALRNGSRAGVPVAEVAGSSAMDSTVGLVAKFGAVLASGALVAGIVAVPHRAPAPSHHPVAASAGSHARHALPSASPASAPGAVPSAAATTAAVPVVLHKLSATHKSVPVSAAARGRGGRAQASSGDGRRGGGSGGDGTSGSRSDGGGPGPSSGTSGSGDHGSGDSGSAGSGDGESSQGVSGDGSSSHGGSSDGGSSHGGSSDGGGTSPSTEVVPDAHGSSSDDGSSSDGGSSGGGSSGGSGPSAFTASGQDSGQSGGGSGGGGPSGSDG